MQRRRKRERGSDRERERKRRRDRERRRRERKVLQIWEEGIKQVAIRIGLFIFNTTRGLLL